MIEESCDFAMRMIAEDKSERSVNTECCSEAVGPIAKAYCDHFWHYEAEGQRPERKCYVNALQLRWLLFAAC